MTVSLGVGWLPLPELITLYCSPEAVVITPFFLAFFTEPEPTAEEVPAEGVSDSFGESLIDELNTENPVEDFAETNPFTKKINPFEDVYKNPFE